jgi:hypothetical protein
MAMEKAGESSFSPASRGATLQALSVDELHGATAIVATTAPAI